MKQVGLILLSLFFWDLSYAQTVVCESQLQSQVNAILATAPQGSLWGVSISVNRLGTPPNQWDQLIGPQNNQLQYFTPASNTKLLATSVAYGLMGPAATFVTPITVLNTTSPTAVDEICVGAVGDPSTSAANMTTIVNAARARGITSINKLSVDTRIFTGAACPDDWEWGDLAEDYGAQPSAAAVNEQVMSVTVTPGAAQGNPVIVTYNGPGSADVFDYVNLATTGTAGSANTISYGYVPGSTALYITGSAPEKGNSVKFDPSALAPDNHYARVLKSYFNAQGIAVNNMAYGPYACSFNPLAAPPANAYNLISLTSPRFDAMINYTLLVSDNLYAELFCRALGVNYGDKSGSTLSQGIRVIQGQVVKMFGATASYSQADGSGLSRRNLISPLLFRELLQGIIEEPWGKDYEALLPVGGETGTLANRFIGTPAQGKVHAKTGSMSGVNSLSGYVDNANYTNIVFSILSNDCVCSSTPLVNVIDSIVVLLAELAPC